jgi:hypothetical protein
MPHRQNRTPQRLIINGAQCGYSDVSLWLLIYYQLELQSLIFSAFFAFPPSTIRA